MSDGYCEVDFSDASDDADPVEFYHSETVRRARKVHACTECAELIEVGESYQRISYRFEGEFHCARICDSCREAASEFNFRMCGGLWFMFEEEWDNGAHIQSCLNRLTSVRAKATMQRKWQQWHDKRAAQRLKAMQRRTTQKVDAVDR